MKGYQNCGEGMTGEGKTEMSSAVNSGVNREAIGMNRSGITLLTDLNLLSY